jgi:hypothetical protein
MTILVIGSVALLIPSLAGVCVLGAPRPERRLSRTNHLTLATSYLESSGGPEQIWEGPPGRRHLSMEEEDCRDLCDARMRMPKQRRVRVDQVCITMMSPCNVLVVFLQGIPSPWSHAAAVINGAKPVREHRAERAVAIRWPRLRPRVELGVHSGPFTFQECLSILCCLRNLSRIDLSAISQQADQWQICGTDLPVAALSQVCLTCAPSVSTCASYNTMQKVPMYAGIRQPVLSCSCFPSLARHRLNPLQLSAAA